MSKRSEQRRAYWREVLERQQKSGLSIRQFCREQQVSEASFHGWKRKLAAGVANSVASAKAGGSPKQEGQTDQGAVFIPVRVSGSAGSLLELVHPRGHVLRVPAGFNEGSLRQVLDVLDHRGGQ